MTDAKQDQQKAAAIVRDAGGQIVGRTRLQKVGYLLELAGFGEGFHFEYRHYGPYSEDLADGIRMARAFGLVTEEERQTDWGGFYSIYNSSDAAGKRHVGPRTAFAEAAAKISAVELELAATAAYLSAVEGVDDPWAETARLKPEKAAEERLENAKVSYKRLLRLDAPQPLPMIV